MGKKQDDLDKIDRLVRDKMIKYLEDNKTDMLTDLSVAVSYLAKNNVVSEKSKSSVEDNTAKKLEDAKKRRGGKPIDEDEEEF